MNPSEILKKQITKAVAQTVQRSDVEASASAIQPVADAVIAAAVPSILSATNNESWWKSRVTWGAIIAIASPVIAAGASWAIGDTITIDAREQAALADQITAVVSAVGGLVAIYGRWVAKKPLGN